MRVPIAALPGKSQMTHAEWSSSDFWTSYLTDALEEGPSLQTSCRNENDRLVLDMNLAESSESHGPTEWKGLYLLLGKVWMEGYPVNWKAYYQGERRQRIELPAYPFVRTRCWVERDDSALDSTGPLQPMVDPINLRPEQLDGYIAPRTEVERELVAAWELYLGWPRSESTTIIMNWEATRCWQLPCMHIYASSFA